MKCTLFVTTILLLALATPATAQWTQTSGPEGGGFTSLIADGNQLIGSLQGGGIVRYTHSMGWSRTSSRPMGRLMMVDGALFGSSSERNFRSTDLGRTWTELPVGGKIYSYNNALHTIENDTLYSSADNGVTWSMTATVPTWTREPVALDGALYAVAGFFGDQLLRSLDGGRNWDVLPNNLPESGTQGRFLAAGPGALYVGFFGSQLYRSTDKGTTWHTFGAGLPENSAVYWVTANGSATWAGTNDRIYRHNGTAWEAVESPSYFTSAVATNDGLLLAAGTGAYLLPNDGTTPNPLTSGLIASSITAIWSHGDLVLASTTSGMFRSLDKGGNWERVADFQGWLFTEHAGMIFTVGEGFYRSRDNGKTWEPLHDHFDDINYSLTGLGSNEHGVYVTMGSSFGEHGQSRWESGGVYRSTNNGDSWQEVSAGLPHDGFTAVPVSGFTATEGYLLVSTYSGVYRSTDNGARWTPSMAGLPQDGTARSYGGEFHHLNGKVYLFSFKKIYESSTGGTSWREIAFGIPDSLSSDYSASPAGGKLYMRAFGMGANGVFPSYTYTFDGTTWEDITSTLPVDVPFTKFTQSGNYLYGGTQRDGVWRMQLPAAGVTPAPLPVAMPAGYPNPTTGMATVRFTLEARTQTALTLTDALGQTVATLHDGVMEAGEITRQVDLSGLPAGTYFVRLATQQGTAVATLVKID